MAERIKLKICIFMIRDPEIWIQEGFQFWGYFKNIDYYSPLVLIRVADVGRFVGRASSKIINAVDSLVFHFEQCLIPLLLLILTEKHFDSPYS